MKNYKPFNYSLEKDNSSQEDIYKILAENLSDILWIFNVNRDKYTFFSPSIHRILGFTVEEALEKNIEFYHPEDASYLRDRIAAAMDEFNPDQQPSKLYYAEAKMQCKDGRLIWVGFNCSLRLNSCNEIEIIGIVRDIDQQKADKEALRQLNATKDKFFSIIAHDLRAPFTGFCGLTDMLVNDIDSMDIESFKDVGMMLNRHAKDMFKLLENLLEWSKMQQGMVPFNPSDLCLQEIVSEVMNSMLSNFLIKNINLISDVPADLNVYADRHMLSAILRNLVSNSLKFTPNGGRVTVSVTPNNEGMIDISVEDNGIGMSDFILENLFIPEKKTNRPGLENKTSSGLGLILVKDFVEKHGGTLTVTSEENKGSRFTVKLPPEKKLFDQKHLA